jgi:hypothetical protein
VIAVTVPTIGAALIVVTWIGCGLYVWSRFLADAYLRELAETVDQPRPWLNAGEAPRVRPGVYDHAARGDFS